METRRKESKDQHERMYTRLTPRRKLCTAVLWMTDREKGGLYHLQDSCTKTGDTILEVLRVKHTEVRLELAASLYSYAGAPPEFTPLNIPEKTMPEVGHLISGGSNRGR